MSININTDQLIEVSLLWGPKVGLALILFLLFWLIASLLSKALIKLGLKTELNDHVMRLLARTVRIVLLLIGLISALGTLGINVSALIAGLGVTGLAVGFALKDTISNLLSGILLLLYQPFSIKDRISVGGKEGVVIGIDLRYTTLEDANNRILIPNSSLFTNSITIMNKNKNTEANN